MKKLFESWRSYINELTYFGGDRPGLAGTIGNNLGYVKNIYPADKQQATGEDLSKSVKVVMHRNGKVLLLKNDMGWDLPGGHMKSDENILSALQREVFEETGLNVFEPKALHYNHGNKVFFQAAFGGGEVKLSDEHTEYGFFSMQQINDFNCKGSLTNPYLKSIQLALGVESDENKKIHIRLRG